MKNLLWIIVIPLVMALAFQRHVLECAPGHYSLCDFRFADKNAAAAILKSWQAPYGDGNILNIAQSTVHWDFLFIIVYVPLILLYSNGQMQNEINPSLNTLLRYNIVLAITAGLFNLLEDFLLLQQFHKHYGIAAAWLAVPKLVFAGWAVAVWLISAIRTKTAATNPL